MSTVVGLLGVLVVLATAVMGLDEAGCFSSASSIFLFLTTTTLASAVLELGALAELAVLVALILVRLHVEFDDDDEAVESVRERLS